MRKRKVEGDETSEQRPSRLAESDLRSSGTFRVRDGRHLLSERADVQPHVFLGLPESSTRVELAWTMRDRGVRVVEFDPSSADWADGLQSDKVDIAVLHANYLNLNCAALANDPGFGFPELVYVLDNSCPAQRWALLSRGYRHVLSVERLGAWLHEELATLCALARARRIVLGACAEKTLAPNMTRGALATGGMNLHLAETHFRETFLRALLAEHGSRRRAADAAGVPYRSFCEMLRKLGI